MLTQLASFNSASICLNIRVAFALPAFHRQPVRLQILLGSRWKLVFYDESASSSLSPVIMGNYVLLRGQGEEARPSVLLAQ